MHSKFELLETVALDDDAMAPAGSFGTWLTDTRQSGAADVPCGACTACCRSSYFIHIQAHETDTLRHIPEALLFAAPGLAAGNVIMGYNEHGACPMLVEERCSIYAHRPQTCRDYDCRIFAATGLAAGDAQKAGVNAQAARWKFAYPDPADRSAHEAVRIAATFLTAHEGLFDDGVLPTNPTQMALLAINVHHLFLDPEHAPAAADTAAAVTQFIASARRG